MNIELSNEKIEQLVEKEVSRYVSNRITSVMNNGEAHWFTRQNIKMLTQNIIMNMIPIEAVKEMMREIDKDVLAIEIGRSIADYIVNEIL